MLSGLYNFIVNTSITQQLHTYYLGQQDYSTVFQKMKDFTEQRSSSSIDEIWLLEHFPVFTLGRNAKEEHILDAGDIPIIPIDRGGQVTYHGSGQLIVYLLLDIRRKNLGVRQLVSLMENAIIQLLKEQYINAYSKPDAPGVYVTEEKVAALGLRITKGRCYHGLSLNIDMDLSPFQRINPCGYKNLKVTDCNHLGFKTTVKKIGDRFVNHYLAPILNYSEISRRTKNN